MSGQSLTFKTLLLSFGKMLATLSSIGITAILTRTLSLDDYATHKQALLIYAMCAPVLMLGLPKALYFFLPGERDRQRSHLLNNMILLLTLGALFLGALSWGGGAFFAKHFKNSALIDLAPFIGLYGLAMIPMGAFSTCMMSTDRVTTLVRFQISAQLVLIAMIACVALYFGTPKATITGYALWASVSVIIAWFFMFRATRGGSQNRPNWSGMKVQLAYGVPLGLASMFGSLSIQIDKFMVSLMCSKEEFVIYVTGALELPIIGIVTVAMNAVILPELAKFYKAGRLDAIISLWQSAMNKAILILAPAMFAVLILGSEMMSFLFSPAYEAASEPLRIYALSLPVRAAVYSSVLMATNRTRWVTLSAIIGLLANATLNMIFVRWLGPSGGAWASVMTTYLVVLFMLFPMCNALGCTLRQLIAWRHLGRVILASGLPAGLLFFIKPAIDAPPFVILIVVGGLYCLLVALMYRIGGITTLGELMGFLKRRSTR